MPAPACLGPDPAQEPSRVDAGTCEQLCSLGLPEQARAVLASPSPFSRSPFLSHELCWDGCKEKPRPCGARACAQSGAQQPPARGGRSLKGTRGASQAVE